MWVGVIVPVDGERKRRHVLGLLLCEKYGLNSIKEQEKRHNLGHILEREKRHGVVPILEKERKRGLGLIQG